MVSQLHGHLRGVKPETEKRGELQLTWQGLYSTGEGDIGEGYQ